MNIEVETVSVPVTSPRPRELTKSERKARAQRWVALVLATAALCLFSGASVLIWLSTRLLRHFFPG